MARWVLGLVGLGLFACGGKSAIERGSPQATAGAGANDGTSSVGTSSGAGADDGMSSAGTSPAGGASASTGTAGSVAATSDVAGAATAADSGVPDSIVGTWRGYVENFKFHDGTDSVSLTIEPDAVSGALAGMMRFGEAKPPAPPTAPDALYPAGILQKGQTKVDSTGAPWPGFGYAMVNPSFDDGRLQFDIAGNELFGPWCVLQTPYKVEHGYACMPDWGFASDNTGVDGCSQVDPASNATVPRNCFQLSLCYLGDTCACTKQSCAADLRVDVPNLQFQSDHFDLNVASSKADGSVAGFSDMEVFNVHLTKE